MSGGSNKWGARGTGDTCNIVISIPSQARTDPPDKQRSVGDEATLEESHCSTWSLQQTERVRSPEPTVGELLQQQHKQEQQHRYRKYQQYQITPEKRVSHHQVWVPNQQQQQEEVDHVNTSTSSKCSGDQDTSSTAKEAWSNQSFSKANVVTNESKNNGKLAEVKCEDNDLKTIHVQQDLSQTSLSKSVDLKTVQHDLSQKSSPKSVDLKTTHVQHNLSQTSSSTSTSPRISRCRRQDRVLSLDEPPIEGVSSEKDVSVQQCQADDGNNYQNFLNGLHQQLSPGKFVESGQNTGIFSEYEIPGLAKPDANPAEITHSVITFQKHSSFETTPILSTKSSDNGVLEKPWSSWRKKKDKKEVPEKGKSNLSVSSCRFLGVNDNQQNTECISPKDDSDTQSRTSSTKGARRLAKRGIGMFPSSNWRRLRNTLKAANEMQSSKKQRHGLNREDSFLRKFSTRNHQNIQNTSNSTDDDCRRSYHSSLNIEGRFVLQHDGNFMFYWLAVVTVSVLYNLWTCIARQAFREIQQGCPVCWYSLDALFDAIYICDILVQFRTGYLDQGLMVYDSKKLRQKYAKSKVIYIDFISLLPLDLVQFAIGVHPMIRFPRFLKIYRPLRFLHMLESRTAYPNLIRVANLTHILFLGAHWFAAFYYMISEAEGFKGEWSYPKPVGEFSDVNRKYLRSLFWSTLTLTTIGDIPPPGNSNDLRMSNAAYVFVIVSYLIGVFVFATIVGQVGNVINNRNASRQEFERLLDGAKIYMQTHSVPHNLQKRVQRWYDYVWSRGRLNGCDINSLGLLPDKLKTELAIHVNLETLKKVTIFQECQPEFLHDLVLKMKAYIFTPGDLICRRGEVAREMFIIADGVVEIISESGVMLKRMGAGDFFGEIGILNLDGGINRRTADVRSVGYLELFVLSREDVLAALKDHPEAESIIRDYGQRRLREVEAHRQKVKPLKCRGSTDQPGNPVGTPQTVQNRFLQTLKSLNPVVRRQSAQINHVGSPPAIGQTASPTDLQRCVMQRGSPVTRAVSGLAKTSSNMQSGLAVVSLDRTDFCTGSTANRFREDYSARRQSFAYFRTAYARFRNVFHRRRGQRRSVDISESRRRELWENRSLFKSADNQAASVDLSSNTVALSPGCSILLNVEDCSQGNMTPDSDDVDDKTNRKEDRSSLRSGVKRGSLLFPGLPDIEARKYGQNLGRVIQRKFSEPVSYMPVCTEDLDEKYSHHSKENITVIETAERPQIVLDVGKISQIWDGTGSSFNEGGITNSDVHCACHEAHKFVASLSDSPGCNIVALDNTSVISNTGSKNDDERSGSDDHSIKGSLTNPTNCDNISCAVNERGDNSRTLETQTDNLRKKGSLGSTINTESACSPYLPQCQSFSSTSTDKITSRLNSAKQRLLDRSPSVRSQGRTPTQTSSESESSRHHSGCIFHTNATIEDPIAPCSSLLTASPSPFSLSCHCDPSDNFKKFIGCHLPESIHHKLIKKNVPGSELPNSRSSNGHVETTDQICSNGGATHRTTNLSPCGCTQTGRSLSFPTLTEPQEDTKNSGAYMMRRPSCQLPEHFIFDAAPGNLTPKLANFREDDSILSKRKGSSNGGRSHAMSIIQQPTSDFSYQQLTAQINVMQGMIEKRLTLLEEAYSSATEKLDYLATSQELLVRLLKQQLLTIQNKEYIQLYPQDGNDPHSASQV